MPQLDPSTFIPQLFWLAITFGVLYFLMARLALPKIIDTIEGRNAQIARDISAAEKMRQECQQLEIAHKAILAEAREKATAYLKGERIKIEAQLAEQTKSFASDMQSKLLATEADIAIARAKGMTEAKNLSREIASAVLTRLTTLNTQEK